MAYFDECVFTTSLFSISFAEAFNEAYHFCVCALLGIICAHVLRILPRIAPRPPRPPLPRPPASKVIEDDHEAVPCFTTLPVDIAASLATFVNVADLSELGVASQAVRERCWEPHQVWTVLAVERHLHSMVPLPVDLAGPRERFRMAYFHLDAGGADDRLNKAREAGGCDWPVRVLEEASHMLSGSMPRDGEALTSRVYDAAEAAFQAHEVLSDSAAQAAEAFLAVARRRSDVVGRWQVRHLEEVRRTALCLEATMGIAMKKFFADLPEVQAEARGFWGETTDQPNQFHVYLPELEDAEYTAMHEAEREAQFMT